MFLDQIIEGLEDFHLATTMWLFPAVFESLFVDTNQWKPQEVMDILQPTKVEMTDAELICKWFVCLDGLYRVHYAMT